MIINFIFPFRRLKEDTLIHSEPRLQVPSYDQPDCGSLTTAVLLWCTSFHAKPPFEYPEMRLMICSGVSSTVIWQLPDVIEPGVRKMRVVSGHCSGPALRSTVMI